MNKNLAKTIISYSICALLLYMVYSLFRIGDVFLYIFNLLLPLIIGIFFHFLLEPYINYMSKNGMNRRIVVIHTYLMFTVFVILGLYFLAPLVFDQCMSFYSIYVKGELNLHPIVNTIIEFLQQYQVFDYLVGIITDVSQSLLYWVTNILLAVGISFYLSFDNLHLIEKLITYLPFDKQGILMRALKRIKLLTHSFIKSLSFDFICFFFMCLIPFYFIDRGMFLWIALFLAITNLIPFIGPYIGGVPVVIYCYLSNPTLGYWAIGVIVVLQYIESSYVQPFLFSKCIHLHPIALLIALTFFGDKFGFIGMIFSPLFLSYVLIANTILLDFDVYKRVYKYITHE